jgi:hypothetical protein
VAAQHVAHLSGAGVFEAWLLAAALPHTRVLWPLRLSWLCAFSTVTTHIAWPLPGRLAWPLLALRAALPLAAAALPDTPLWLHTSPGGVATQAAACAFAAGVLTWRDRVLEPQYARQIASLRVAQRRKALKVE